MNKFTKNMLLSIPTAILVLLSLAPQPVFSQEVPKASEPTHTTPQSPDAAASSMAEAGKLKLGDDPTIWLLIILFNLAVAVTIERSWVLFRSRGKNTSLVGFLTERLRDEHLNPDELADELKTGYGSEGRIASVTLRGWNHGVHAMAEFAQSAVTAEKRFLEKRLVVLSTLGANTPFIGLLGTVLGIMKAFRDLAAMGDAGPSVVMKGISEALIATAAGLGVAIPCVIAFNLLTRAVKNKMANAEEVVTLLRALRITAHHPATVSHHNTHAAPNGQTGNQKKHQSVTAPSQN